MKTVSAAEPTAAELWKWRIANSAISDATPK
jgi:hypothetical protein